MRDRRRVGLVESAIVGVFVGELAVVAEQEFAEHVVVGASRRRHGRELGEGLDHVGVCVHVSSGTVERRRRPVLRLTVAASRGLHRSGASAQPFGWARAFSARTGTNGSKHNDCIGRA